MRRDHSPDVIAGKINADSSLAWATEDGLSSGRTPGSGAGDYTITMPVGFRPMSVQAINGVGNMRICSIILSYGSTGQWTTRILQYATSGTLTDEPVFFTIVGWQQ